MPQDTDYKYVVCINWKNGDTVSNWNEKCAYALEHFGLPGYRFVTHAQQDYMQFMFKDEVDAIHFSLACL